MKVTKVFSRNLESYLDEVPLIVNQGGTSSSKTFSILQLLLNIALYSIRPLIISVVSYSLPHLKLGAVRDFENILIDAGINIDSIKNKSDINYKIGNSIIEFFSADNIGKVHGPRRDILYLNECNNIKYDIYTQLRIRTRKCCFIDYNPTSEFWVHTDVIPNEKHKFIKSTYKDNSCLDQSIIDQIEARKNNENWWRVYGLGEVGQLEGAILKNWKYGKFDNDIPYGYGLDFGVTDPDAMLKVGVDKANRKLYWKEEIYKTGNSTGALADLMQTKVELKKLIIAESASPRTILDLRSRGFNIKAVKKGRVLDDIKMLLEWEIIVDEDSYNLGKELNNWVWLDKTGEITIDAFNHLIDAGRYYTRTVVNPITTQGHKIL